MKVSYHNYKCDFFRYNASALGTCPLVPSSSDVIVTLNMKYSMNL